MEFIETSIFARQIDALLDEERKRELQLELLADPTKGALVPRGGGIRKLRFSESTRGKGRRGGIRIIYYLEATKETVYLLLAYSKGKQEDLTAEQIRQLREYVKRYLK